MPKKSTRLKETLLPCRGCGALVHTEQAVRIPCSVENDTCPVCRWGEDMEGFPYPDVWGFQPHLYLHQRGLEQHGPFAFSSKKPRNFKYDRRYTPIEPLRQEKFPYMPFDPEFRFIQVEDFLMSDRHHRLLVDFGSDVETWFYWRNNFWHKNPQILRKKSFVRKLRQIMQNPERRKTERPAVHPCNRCGGPLEWYVRRNDELAFKCPACKVLFMRGSSLFDGPPLAGS